MDEGFAESVIPCCVNKQMKARISTPPQELNQFINGKMRDLVPTRHVSPRPREEILHFPLRANSPHVTFAAHCLSTCVRWWDTLVHAALHPPNPPQQASQSVVS